MEGLKQIVEEPVPVVEPAPAVELVSAVEPVPAVEQEVVTAVESAVEPEAVPAEQPVLEPVAEPVEESIAEPTPVVEPVKKAKPSFWKIFGRTLLVLVITAVVALAAYLLIARFMPGVLDNVLYTPEELEIINKSIC